MFLCTTLAALFYLISTCATQNSYFFNRILVPNNSDDSDVEVNVYELNPDTHTNVPVVREENHRIEHDNHVVGRLLNMLQLRPNQPENRRNQQPVPMRRMFRLQRSSLSFGTYHFHKWSDGVIPFVIDLPLRRIEELIFRAMREIESKSCVKFKKRENEDDFILLRPANGCFSAVGKRGGRQVVSLGHGCENFGIILHELMHVVGFYHLHQRHDRDKFLNIHWDNINPSFLNNFKLLSPDLMPTDDFFDYQSIMMYGSSSFSKDRKSVTMTPSRPGARIADPAQKNTLSSADVRSINRMYDCNAANNFIDF